jgi:hypothetical protein
VRIDRSHQMKISVVDNHEGPRTQQVTDHVLAEGVRERVHNIEAYLDIPTGMRFDNTNIVNKLDFKYTIMTHHLVKSVPLDVYQRLQQIEEKLLQMEQD